ncbi:MAG: hypothetical protein JSW58_07250 [Candidatus Latescibacterota bacterium]|nr:MAG: hypothetical protein JSW58_07250 [Candidatus Latescibacterota bacterium]
MRRIVSVVLVAVLFLCWFLCDSRADSSGFEDLGEGMLVVAIGVVVVPISAGFIIVNLGELANDDPSLTIAAWGLGFGIAATSVGVRLLEYSDSDERGLAVTVTAIGATCSVLSAVNMYRAYRAEGYFNRKLQLEPAAWLDSRQQTVFGVRVKKSF